jgi:hypothetical protein
MRTASLLALAALAAASAAQADSGHDHGIASDSGNTTLAPFDIVHTRISTEGSINR